MAVAAKALRLLLYYFLTPGSHWFYRFTKNMELLVFLLKNFVFDAKTLKSVVSSLLARQKPEHYYLILHKIASDFDHLARTLRGAKGWAAGRAMLRSVEGINVALEGIAEKAAGRSGVRFCDLLGDPARLRTPIHPKDKLWTGADADLAHVERLSDKLIVG